MGHAVGKNLLSVGKEIEIDVVGCSAYGEGQAGPDAVALCVIDSFSFFNGRK